MVSTKTLLLKHYHRRQGRPPKTTQMTKMAGLSQAKAWFTKSRVCSSHSVRDVGCPCMGMEVWEEDAMKQKSEKKVPFH